jgi:hypothetical protein
MLDFAEDFFRHQKMKILDTSEQYCAPSVLLNYRTISASDWTSGLRTKVSPCCYCVHALDTAAPMSTRDKYIKRSLAGPSANDTFSTWRLWCWCVVRGIILIRFVIRNEGVILVVVPITLYRFRHCVADGVQERQWSTTLVPDSSSSHNSRSLRAFRMSFCLRLRTSLR